MCDCGGRTDAGRYFALIGGQAGDRLTGYGQALGSQVAKRFKSWTGLGDYQLHGNSLIAGSGGIGQPQVRTSGRAIIVSYKEYIGEVVTSPSAVGAFNVTSYRINPADIATFPWLAPIAQQFDQYQPLGILFEFKSTATDYTATTASLGSVIMMTEYDVRDSAPDSKGEMLNTAYSQESKMSEHAIHGIECDPGELQRSIFYCKQNAENVLGEDNRDYDVGTFYVATQGGGLPVAQSVGSLYVHYEFAFFKEQPIGGIFNKAWPFYVTEGIVNSGTQVRTTDISNFPVTVGNPMGIVFSQAGFFCSIVIPRRWQGAYLRFSWLIRASPLLASVPTFTNSFGLGGATNSTLPADMWLTKYRASAQPPFLYVVQSTGPTEYEMYVKLADVMNDQASISFTDPLNLHPTTSQYFGAMKVELLNEEYFST